jgi:protein-disulfide isomerase
LEEIKTETKIKSDSTDGPDTPATATNSKPIIIGLVLGLVLGGVIGILYANSTKKAGVEGALTTEQIKITTEAFINQNLLQPGITARVEDVTEKSGLYLIKVKLNSGTDSQVIDSYVSKDGTLFFTDFIDTTQPVPTSPPTTTSPPVSNIDMKALIDDDPWVGNKDADVIIVEFSDFQCPFCARALPTVNQIKETYGDDILFVYRDFPLRSIHPQAQKAAEASQCAFEQDKFWEYHDLLFEKQSSWSGVGVPIFKEYAVDLGLDTDTFNDCLDSNKYADEVEADLQEGSHFGVTGTPAFFINGQKISGAQPFTIFKQIIDVELAKTA